ncbi:glutathione S-transferas-like protein [Calycina marina]|uniref:Glutathione S-transferas-like protein n=1 Tax=Calycina marina TaxID=1763456 RepID=A0A9P7YXH9_9HELO|nr:glutathione S-transferas-like protein [Calycina marina]
MPSRASVTCTRASSVPSFLTQTVLIRGLSASMKMTEGKITNWVDPKDKTGEFKRGASQFRNFIKKGGEFPPEAGRYHLYVSYACPWAHRTLIVRKLKGLEEVIPFTSVHWSMLEKGWRFTTPEDAKDSESAAPGENVRADPVPGHEKFTHLRDVYFGVDPEYKGRFTVPALYDVKQGRIVSNESSEIIRMFYTEFDDLLPSKYKDIDLFPQELQAKIEASNEWIYSEINNGVYRSGFATTQSAYTSAVTTLFTALDRVEAHLSSSPGPYYFGANITEADVRLYTTIVRFDVVYVQHFKCNLRDIRGGYPAIHRWVRGLYWGSEAFGGTTEFTHIKRHYTRSHSQINPFGITPEGPDRPILELDDELPAVEYTLEMSKKNLWPYSRRLNLSRAGRSFPTSLIMPVLDSRRASCIQGTIEKLASMCIGRQKYLLSIDRHRR